MGFWRASRIPLLASCAALGAAWPAGSFAHDSPEHEITAISARIASTGKSAELLARRAMEWRALGNLENASADLEAAMSLNKDSAVLLAEFARIEAARHRYPIASNAITRALNMNGPNAGHGAFYMLRAEILEDQQLTTLALADCERAFQLSDPSLDWYLTRARLQSRGGKMREAAEGLKEGFEKTGSLVLEIEWIEAMIDTGEFKKALDRIKPHLQRTRWKAAWLIRQGRAQLGLNDRAAAFEDLRIALAELDRRINPGNPDVILLAERSLANALLNHCEGARADLGRIRALNANSTIYLMGMERIERLLRE